MPRRRGLHSRDAVEKAIESVVLERLKALFPSTIKQQTSVGALMVANEVFDALACVEDVRLAEMWSQGVFIDRRVGNPALHVHNPKPIITPPVLVEKLDF